MCYTKEVGSLDYKPFLDQRHITGNTTYDLKIDHFRADYKGQMELYLRWLAKYEQESDEQPPLGIILCAGKKQEQVELLEMDNSGIHVAEYLTVLPSKALLEQRLHQAIVNAKQRLENQSLEDKEAPQNE